MFVELVLFVIVIVAYWLYSTRLPANYPPSPPVRLPILGHAHYLWFNGTHVNEAINNLYKKYNKNGVFAFHLGMAKTVLIGERDHNKKLDLIYTTLNMIFL
jgi:hypothetical protein